ncbi:hypothetical protein [Bacillus sp. SLBN-46]|uniref:hypothetical protein n=1 Tax=Bacillus sp. SLBN-46 TaxID=3042283 RepID=UPI00286CB551|nr:hypothetical protein [Bacillus sp. SLBN-46]
MWAETQSQGIVGLDLDGCISELACAKSNRLLAFDKKSVHEKAAILAAFSIGKIKWKQTVRARTRMNANHTSW